MTAVDTPPLEDLQGTAHSIWIEGHCSRSAPVEAIGGLEHWVVNIKIRLGLSRRCNPGWCLYML